MPNFLMFIILIALATFIFYLPILINPDLLVARNNDLSNFFWPLVYYAKNQIIKTHQIPLWNIMFFSGTPLLPDPQNPAFYLPNIIFLITSIDKGFLISLVFHSLLAGVGMYLAARSFKLSKTASIFTALLFVLSPKLMGYVEAGHFGLITSWAFFPWIIFSIRKNLPVLFAASLAAIFYTHILTFAITALASVVFLSKEKIKFFLLGYLILLALIAPILIPQLSWQKETTRDLLLKTPDVYPVWNTKAEFIKNIFSASRDTEKNVVLGVIPLFFAAFGFLRTRRITKVYLATSFVFIALVSLSNASPLYSLLLKQNWFLLLRVETRVWFIVVVSTILLAGQGLNYLLRIKRKYFLIIAAFGIIEYLSGSYFILAKPTQTIPSLPSQAYAFFQKDKDLYRIFCLTRCIAQKEAAIYNLELVEGYGTLQQKNYYRQSQQLAQAFWRNRYTLSIPPFEIYLYENLQPIASELAKYRVKYVVSKNVLNDKNLKQVEKFEDYLIYRNLLYSSPNYLIYTPNFIRVEVTSRVLNKLIIPEVYSKNWRAYLNGQEKAVILETKDATREVIIKKDTDFVDFKYEY